MRGWFNKNLLLNLEKNNRCMVASRLIQEWLTESCLTGDGSSVTRARFPAIPPEPHSKMTFRDLDDDQRIKLEVRGEVGRMLWKEVWGRHVEGESWWWEDEDIVEECHQLGTCWEYYLFEAVNQKD